ncbi:MAG: ATP synthase F1 subunit gamma [Phycisphaerae bacterium]|jgi:F-type H+-transporting ATPase subunit gamma
MAKARAIVKRRKTVQNIRKITRTMQLIATARFQAAYTRATASRPYTERITELAEQLSRGTGQIDHPLLRVNVESNRSAVVVITSNRGFCGGYNAAVLRAATEHVRTAETAGRTVDLHVMGRKGIGFFKFLNRPMASTDTRFEDKPRFEDVNAFAERMIAAYQRREIDAVHVSYTRFISTSVQRAATIQLLPIERPAGADGAAAGAGVEYEFTPPAAELLAELLPETVKVRLFQCFMDAAVSEQVARMVAMKSATDAAGDMVKSLTQQYNRARQSQITLELLDIVSGAEAIK